MSTMEERVNIPDETLMENNTEQVEMVYRENAIIQDDLDECCIYTVPEFIKKGKEECYEPLVISIGPIFYNDPKLKAMQELKHIYLKSFIELPNNASHSLEPYNNFVRKHESKIRKCYQEEISIPSEELIDMIVLDAAFLIFLFLSNYPNYRPSYNTELHKIENKLYLLRKFIRRDILWVEENQVPFFVLEGMWSIAFGDEGNLRDQPLTITALDYIQCNTYFPAGEVAISIIEGIIMLPDALSIKHLVHLQRECCCLLFSRRPKELKSNSRIYHTKTFTAKQLSVAGVIFQPNESDDLLHITFDKSSGVLKIPKLSLEDGTEAFFKSILFFEQCHVHMDRYITNYFVFLDGLIDTIEDIQILQQNEILQNRLGSDEEAVELFNKLTKNTFYSAYNFAFTNVSKDLNDYASMRWNRWKAIFWQKYFNHPWAIISVIYAIILLMLTIVQTISGFISK